MARGRPARRGSALDTGLPRVRESAAPPVRGSAPGTAATQDGHTDRPARTGGRRIRRSLAGQWNRPLRTGGDPPTSSGIRCPNRSAAPHRRGSAPAGRRPHAGRRLPARAGIRPLPGRYSGQSPGQPRGAGISQRPGTNGADRQHLPRRDGGTEQTPGPWMTKRGGRTAAPHGRKTDRKHADRTHAAGRREWHT